MKRWIIAGVTIVVLAVAAAVVVPKVLHMNRVAAYGEVTAETDRALSAAHAAQLEAAKTTVLYALQYDEAGAFHQTLEELAGFTDDYFSDVHRAALAAAGEELDEALTGDLSLEGMSDDERDAVEAAQTIIERDGIIWQTDFLNLTVEALDEVVDHPSGNEKAEQMVLVADEEVTNAVLDDARATLADAQDSAETAEESLATAEGRSAALIALVEAALEPLSESALAVPEQAERVLEMYPDADPEVAAQLRDAAAAAAEVVAAEQFTNDEEYRVVPLRGEAPEDRAVFEATDAWRAPILADHLIAYTKGVTGAWISDAGSLEEALGFNPYYPFIR